MAIEHPPEFCEIAVANGNDLTFTAKKWADEPETPLDWVVLDVDGTTELYRGLWVGDLSHAEADYEGETGWVGPFLIGLDDGAVTAWSGDLDVYITNDDAPAGTLSVVKATTGANELTITLDGLGEAGAPFSHYELELDGVAGYTTDTEATDPTAEATYVYSTFAPGDRLTLRVRGVDENGAVTAWSTQEQLERPIITSSPVLTVVAGGAYSYSIATSVTGVAAANPTVLVDGAANVLVDGSANALTEKGT